MPYFTTLKRGASTLKKAAVRGQWARAKARGRYQSLAVRLKPHPDTNRALEGVFPPPVKPCPDTKPEKDALFHHAQA